MANIEKRHIIDSQNLSREFYFNSILQEAYNCELLDDYDIEKIQMECMRLLSCKSKRYNFGQSSSIRVETAKSIMKSNLYTIGLYLKSLQDADYAVKELKNIGIFELYERGRKLVSTKLHTAKHIYKLVQKNRIATMNYTYNATLGENGIEIFFKSYDPDYEAHEFPASIDYQLCNPVTDLVGVEFIQKYLENLYLENKFCKNFAAEDIHHLLYGYNKGYKDLLINIFEHVLLGALGCSLVNCNIIKLNITEKDIRYLSDKLLKYDDNEIALKVYKAIKRILKELNIINPSLRDYIKKSLPKIISNIINGVRTDNLGKVFARSINQELKPKIYFLSDIKMDDKDYRKLIDELLVCRYSSDKLALIKEKVKSFGDLEDVLFDAQLTTEEIISVFKNLEDIEMAAMIERHPFNSDGQAVDLSETEELLQFCLKRYVDQLPKDKQEEIFEKVDHLMDD
ncbi:DUF6179 domain-containing protein [Schnuerera sp. xch1]|uniref:DUF6179 domain-containing protein n=1 Tax=Schnuerera sp. xch1 TaxID=2874283 RepID=UPI001CBBC7CF|nr:DUF6179 domain-containing protein [Schnuerera sp. xch1]MBZ2174634.1 DUF6179 domain-containing protein [Schnuerera sp. xch1]